MSTTKKHAGIKYLRKSTKLRAKNVKAFAQIELLIKNLKKTVLAKDASKIKEAFGALVQAADKAHEHGVATKNMAARIKSRASHFIATAR